MIAKLETPLSNAQKTRTKLTPLPPPPPKKKGKLNKAMVETMNNESAVLERSAEATGGLN